MSEWTLLRSKTDGTVLVVCRARDDGRLDVRRLALDSFDLAPEDVSAVYEPVEPDGETVREVFGD